MNCCGKCSNLINEYHKFCTKIVEQVEEEIIVKSSEKEIILN